MLIKRHSTVLALGTSGQFIESDFHSQKFEKIAAESQQKLIVSMDIKQRPKKTLTHVMKLAVCAISWHLDVTNFLYAPLMIAMIGPSFCISCFQLNSHSYLTT